MCEAIGQLSGQLLEQLFYWVESWTMAKFSHDSGPILLFKIRSSYNNWANYLTHVANNCFDRHNVNQSQ